MIHPVILCGGSGTRLWPAESRKAYPKQFAPLLGQKQSLSEALCCISGRRGFAAPLVMTGEEFRSWRSSRPRAQA